MHTELIAIILCTRNEKTVNSEVYSSIVLQNYSNIELVIEEGIGNNNIIRNKGFANSKGKYIFFMDEDIILYPECLVLLYEQLVRCLADFCYCNYARIGDLTGIQRGRDFDIKRLKIMNYISTMTLMKRSVFPGFDPEIKRLQDWDLFLTIVENGGVGAFVDKCLFAAIYNEGGISTKGSDDWLANVDIVKRKHGLL